MKIALIGNSHVASFLHATKGPASSFLGSHQMTFFAANGTLLKDMYARDGKLYPANQKAIHSIKQTSDGLDHIDLLKYDCFILVGSDIDILPQLDLYKRYRGEMHISRQLAPMYISDECFALASLQLFEDSTANNLIHLIKTHSNRPVMLLPTPFPATIIQFNRDYEWLQDVFDQEELQELKSFYQSTIKRAFPDTPCLFPPEEVLDTPISTQSEYLKDSLDLFLLPITRIRDNDVVHMNEKYGTIMLQKVFDHLANK